MHQNGAGADIHLAIESIELAFERISGAIGEFQFPDQSAEALRIRLARLKHFTPCLQVILFAGREVHQDWIHSGNSGEGIHALRTDEIAHLGVGDAGDAIYRGSDRGKPKV